MANETHVRGLADLQKLLDTLPQKVETNILRGALRAGMVPIQAEAKRNAAVSSGLLRDGLKISTNNKYGKVTASLKTRGKHGYLANWIEFGTQPHEIKPKSARSLFLAGIFRELVQHPGAKPRPFMRPALDSQAQAALVRVGEYIKARLAKKHGLDTADIQIGDE